ncbi:hypothetical protein [Streptomyces sp. NPDC060035]|uniref:hypothetical protein n=1 Tax=Streptomyces sp. NPDC060035 TaxID=3347044 RepID=UPI0036A11B0C
MVWLVRTGRAIVGAEVKVAAQDDQDVPNGTVGEIVVRNGGMQRDPQGARYAGHCFALW